MKPVKWFKGLTTSTKVLLTSGALATIVAMGVGASPNQGQPTTPSSKPSSQSTPKITTRIETEAQTIPFTSTNVENSTMAKGTTSITTAGVNGRQTLTYKLTYKNGKQTDKKLINTVVTSQPIVQVISVGTYVAPSAPSCPNGTYVNSAGNTVCSPYQSPSAPAGATARCVDGTYSFSQSRSGTCSHHGGVAQWL